MSKLQDRLDSDYYTTKLPYCAYREDRTMAKAYWEDQQRLTSDFQADLFEEYEVTGHPKADLCYDLAYEYGQAAVYSEVHSYFSNLVQLIK